MQQSPVDIRAWEARRDVASLIGALADGDAGVRRAAAEALGHLCDPCPAEARGSLCNPCALGSLRRAAEDQAVEVCLAAMDALQKICAPATLGIP